MKLQRATTALAHGILLMLIVCPGCGGDGTLADDQQTQLVSCSRQLDRARSVCAGAERATPCTWAAEVGVDITCPDATCLATARATYRVCAERLGPAVARSADCIGVCALTSDQCNDDGLRQLATCAKDCRRGDSQCLGLCTGTYGKLGEACLSSDASCRSRCLTQEGT